MITIRKADTRDFKKLIDIWPDASKKAHHFIPETYWHANKLRMQADHFPLADVYLAEGIDEIYGFIALVDNTIASIFVSPTQQEKGISRTLINCAQKMKDYLELTVYQENINNVEFYQSMGFRILNEAIDKETNSKEFAMRWEKSL